MWYVEKVGVGGSPSPNDSEIYWRPNLLYIPSDGLRYSYVQLVIKNDETGEVKRAIGYDSVWDELDAIVASRPYGVVGDYRKNGGNLMFRIRAVDEMCVKFLSLVADYDEVQFAAVPPECVSYDLSLVRSDVHCSMLSSNISHNNVKTFPLLHAVVHAPEGWCDDGYYYLMCARQKTMCGRFSFYDCHEARMFAAKAKMIYGCDPVNSVLAT